MKIACYGVRDYEKEYFYSINEKYNYELELFSFLLTNENIEHAFGYQTIMVRGNCFLNDKSIERLSKHGLKCLLTRTVGYNHIDLDAIKKYNIKAYNVPSYSPNSVAELALTFAITLNRNLLETLNNTKNLDYRFKNEYFTREIRSLKVGIIGCGRIGKCLAKLFNGLGATVLGYDNKNSNEKLGYLKYVDLDFLLENSDIISLHMPLTKTNVHFINKDTVSKMKKGVILINTARGELIDLNSLIYGFEKGIIGGVALDVIENENKIFFKELDKLDNPLLNKLYEYYPRFIITPHIGSATNEALKNMIEISFNNLKDFLELRKSSNELK